MRDENLVRFASYKDLSKSDFYYLELGPLIRDLEIAVDKYSKGKVLDIGCGNKPYESMFEKTSTGYTGCDIVQSSLQKVDILCEANNIPLEDNTFDTVFSTQTIEHVADHQGLVNEAFRLVKPEGYFIVSGPLYWPLHEEPYDYFRFTKHGFEYILTKAGFSVVEVLSNGGMWATTGQSIIHSMTNSKSRKFFVRVLRFIFYKLRGYRAVNSLFRWLDKVDYNPINTMNYVVVARKAGRS